jgi:hypothetical protein
MPAAIDPVIKKQVINQWLSGGSRDRIAADNGIGAGTVSNIIDEWKKGVSLTGALTSPLVYPFFVFQMVLITQLSPVTGSPDFMRYCFHFSNSKYASDDVNVKYSSSSPA